MFEYQGWQFDSIESIPFPEENFEIIKVTNLRNFSNKEIDTRISEPSFVLAANAPFWHFMQEGLAQYEIILSKLPNVKLFFHDFHYEQSYEKYLSIDDYSQIKNQYQPYIKDLANIYSFDKKIHMTNKTSILIEECYFINDISRLLDRDLILKQNIIPYWIKATDAEGKWIHDWEIKRASPYFHEDCVDDRWQMDGLKLVKNRLLPYVKKDKIYSKKIFISREDVNTMWTSISPNRSFTDEKILIDYFVSRGYNKVVLTDYGYIDQINIIFNATHIAGLVGSGLFNSFLCEPGTKLFEMHVSGNYYWSYKYFEEFGIQVNSIELRWRKDYMAVMSDKNINKLKELVEKND